MLFIMQCVSQLHKLATAERKQVVILVPPDALGIARKHYSPVPAKANLERNLSRLFGAPDQGCCSFLSQLMINYTDHGIACGCN